MNDHTKDSSNIISFRNAKDEKQTKIERKKAVDVKQRLMNWRAVFNNSPSESDTEQKALDHIITLCDQLPDSDEEKMRFVIIAADFGKNEKQVRTHLKKLAVLAPMQSDVSEQMYAYRMIVNNSFTEPALKEQIVAEMVKILETYDDVKENEVVSFSELVGKKSKPKAKKPKKPTKKDS